MALAKRTTDPFAEQPTSEKQSLLKFVLSNSFWAGGELAPAFRQPLDMHADIATVGAQKWLLDCLPAANIDKNSPSRIRISQTELTTYEARDLRE